MALIEFRFPNAAAPTTSWLPAKNQNHPETRPEDRPFQLSARSGSGVVYVQNKGVSQTIFDLTFDRITQADRDSFKTFWQTVNKSEKTFEYRDPAGVLHTVRIINADNFQNVTQDRYSGSVRMRKES